LSINGGGGGGWAANGCAAGGAGFGAVFGGGGSRRADGIVVVGILDFLEVEMAPLDKPVGCVAGEVRRGTITEGTDAGDEKLLAGSFVARDRDRSVGGLTSFAGLKSSLLGPPNRGVFALYRKKSFEPRRSCRLNRRWRRKAKNARITRKTTPPATDPPITAPFPGFGLDNEVAVGTALFLVEVGAFVLETGAEVVAVGTAGVGVAGGAVANAP